jgi:hypothetical protein
MTLAAEGVAMRLLRLVGLSLLLVGSAVFAQTSTPRRAEPELTPLVISGGPNKGSVALRTGFVGSFGSSSFPRGLFAVIPTIGTKVFVSDRIGLTLDGGFLARTGRNSLAGFSVDLGIEAHLWRTGTSLRPFLRGGLGVGKPASGVSGDFFGSAEVGGGAEYWFSDQFSLSGRAMVTVSYFGNPDAFVLATFTPGVLAAFYF